MTTFPYADWRQCAIQHATDQLAASAFIRCRGLGRDLHRILEKRATLVGCCLDELELFVLAADYVRRDVVAVPWPTIIDLTADASLTLLSSCRS